MPLGKPPRASGRSCSPRLQTKPSTTARATVAFHSEAKHATNVSKGRRWDPFPFGPDPWRASCSGAPLSSIPRSQCSFVCVSLSCAARHCTFRQIEPVEHSTTTKLRMQRGEDLATSLAHSSLRHCCSPTLSKRNRAAHVNQPENQTGAGQCCVADVHLIIAVRIMYTCNTSHCATSPSPLLRCFQPDILKKPQGSRPAGEPW